MLIGLKVIEQMEQERFHETFLYIEANDVTINVQMIGSLIQKMIG